ncbi:beta-phosphoglucomutase [Bacillus alkalicellulosilyticus]|uniref:beta-phosphoglucomutase n=1 Tax=Alkalihalobacterium alkalicellulosilyticum TaxID=1912214 RepID=UPI00099875FD|nr:beta-phosphoglucomutase [Bacillus alkalicellulosilyticus]
MTKGIRAVIFDLDGVIADTVELHYEATKRVADEVNLPFTREINERMQGRGRMELIEELVKGSNQTFSEIEKKELGNRKNRYYQELISNLTKEDVLPGMYDFIQNVKEHSIPLAIASSSSNALLVIKNLEIKSFFDYIVDVKKIKKMKPDPEIILYAADRLGVPYQQCVAIEDSEAGMKAIKSTPMFSIGIGSNTEVKQADWHVQDTKEITYKQLVNRYDMKQ